MAEAPGIPKFSTSALSQIKFFVPPASAEIEFVRGDDGVVTHLLFRQDGRQQRGGSAHPTVRLSKGSVWILEHPSLDGGRVRRAVRLREGRT